MPSEATATATISDCGWVEGEQGLRQTKSLKKEDRSLEVMVCEAEYETLTKMTVGWGMTKRLSRYWDWGVTCGARLLTLAVQTQLEDVCGGGSTQEYKLCHVLFELGTGTCVRVDV